MLTVVFIYNGIETIIQCLKNDKMKDICNKFVSKAQLDINNLFFIYGSNILNLELTYDEIVNEIDKERNNMKILVNENNKKIIKNDGIIKSKDIICPKCLENCLIDINNYKIKLYDCKNGHDINNISLNEYNNTQNINLNNIICNKCDNNKNISYDHQFFKCLTCKQNICPKCKSIHDNNHNIINYDNINYICHIHDDYFISYCNKCKMNLCIQCKLKHDKNHEIINFENIYPNIDEIKVDLNEFKNRIDNLNKDINDIIKMLNTVKEVMDICYKIYYDLIYNFKIQKKNYHILKNINCIKNNINIINDIDKIIKENNRNNKIKNILNLYNKIKNKEEFINNNDNSNKMNNNKEFSNNEIILRYNINDAKDNKIKIFGKDFVNNNKNNCKILCENKLYELIEYFDISNYNNKDILEIKLQGINHITNASSMFSSTNSLSSLSELSKWDTSNVTNIFSYLLSILIFNKNNE